MKLGSVLVFAKDLPRMHAFYRDALGLVVVEERDGFVTLDAGGAQLALHAIPEAYARHIQIADPPAPRSDTPIKMIFEVDDVPATRERLIARGAGARDLAIFGDGRAACDCFDPEGNVFRISNR
jgi:catechol 2,3-dioxygenase-like lactoylglutathione lyase family enzyme